MKRETSAGGIYSKLRGKVIKTGIKKMRIPGTLKIHSLPGSFKDPDIHMGILLITKAHLEVMTILILSQNGMI